MPSSLTTLLPPACGFSPYLPVSVCGTGTSNTIAAFLGSVDSSTSLLSFGPHHASLLRQRGLPPCHSFALDRVFPFPGLTILLRPHSSDCLQYRNFYLLSIDYDSRPRLRPRLTLRRLALLRNPQIFGLYVSHIYLATHSGILSPVSSTVASAPASSLQDAPLPLLYPKYRIQCFGVVFQPR